MLQGMRRFFMDRDRHLAGNPRWRPRHACGYPHGCCGAASAASKKIHKKQTVISWV